MSANLIGEDLHRRDFNVHLFDNRVYKPKPSLVTDFRKLFRSPSSFDHIHACIAK